MDAEVFRQYVTERYEDQIGWYGRKAAHNKRLYQIFQWEVIVLSATVPVLVASLPTAYQWLTILVSVALAIGTAGLKTFRFQEDWISYRSTAETLQKEQHFYAADVGDYGSSDDKEALFVERVEALLSSENIQWVTTHTKAEEEDAAE